MQEKSRNSRLLVSFVVYAVWAAITLLGGLWMTGGKEQALIEGLSKGPLWNVIAAFVFLLIVIKTFGWRDLKFVAPKPMSSLKIMWLPALYIISFLSMAVVLGLPSIKVILFVFLSTAFVGLSEETMFRGIMFQALRSRFALWPAIILTSVLFGSVHILNAFTTGEVLNSFLQAFTATLSGFAFIALLVRTGSIWPSIVYHALWDFGTFSMSATQHGSGGGDVPGILALLLPVILVLPDFLYGVYLMRNVRNTTTLSTDPDGDVRAA